MNDNKVDQKEPVFVKSVVERVEQNKGLRKGKERKKNPKAPDNEKKKT